MAYTLSQDQAKALGAIGAWYREKQAPFITLGGYAGTGKTTMIALLRQALHEYDKDTKVAFCAYTGKASQVLRQKLREQKTLRRGDNVSTIHSLIYNSSTNSEGHTSWDLKKELAYNIIIVDEASMVDEYIWNDLLSFQIPVLAVGDHGQLPPINSNFNLMAEPQLKLEQIFRQEAESPIIQVAQLARTNGAIPIQDFGPGVTKLNKYDSETGQAVEEMLGAWRGDLMVLCGYNHTRVSLNKHIRSLRDIEVEEPTVGDVVVCLRNMRSEHLYNGLIGTIVSIEPAPDDETDQWYWTEIYFDNENMTFSGYTLREQFGAKETIKRPPKAPGDSTGALFDFGYALTVHKAQGSQSPRVLLFEERFSKMSDEDWNRWLYTAVTRAETELTIIGTR
jgi:exodeoxyribonuclease-5